MMTRGVTSMPPSSDWRSSTVTDAAAASSTEVCFCDATMSMPTSAALASCDHSRPDSTVSRVTHSETSTYAPSVRRSREMLCSSANHLA